MFALYAWRSFHIKNILVILIHLLFCWYIFCVNVTDATTMCACCVIQMLVYQGHWLHLCCTITTNWRISLWTVPAVSSAPTRSASTILRYGISPQIITENHAAVNLELPFSDTVQICFYLCALIWQVCDGNDDCGNRMDEKNCPAEKLGYEIRLAGSNQSHQGRIEVKGNIIIDTFHPVSNAIVSSFTIWIVFSLFFHGVQQEHEGSNADY